MALSADTPRTYELGDVNTLPVKGSTTIYEGAAVGDDGSGYARGLVANDPFRGFAIRQADNSADSTDGAINVQVKTKGQVYLAVTSLAITDVGKNVYASADGTFVLTAASGTRIGRVKRYVSSGYGIVEFDATKNDGVAAETIYGTLGVTGVLTATGGITVSADSTLGDGVDIAVNTTTGSKIGTATNQKLGFYNATPVDQAANTEDLKDVLVALGFIATGGATPLNLDSGAITAGDSNTLGSLTITDAKDVTLGTTTGTKIGAATNQKLGFLGATPVVRQAHIADTSTAYTQATTSELVEISTTLNSVIARLETFGFSLTS